MVAVCPLSAENEGLQDAGLRFAQLSPTRQALVRLSQQLNFGQILNLVVRDGNPVFAGATPRVLAEERLDVEDVRRAELHLADFELCREWNRLLARIDKIQNGTIDKV